MTAAEEISVVLLLKGAPDRVGAATKASGLAG
jgi:hypothetical protein